MVQNRDFKPIPNNNLIRSNNWVHKNPCIQSSGIANSSDFSMPPLSTINEELSFTEDEEYSNYSEDSLNHKEELFGNLKNDIGIDNTPAWKGTLCSPFDYRNSYTMMKSHIWPGACAVARGLCVVFKMHLLTYAKFKH